MTKSDDLKFILVQIANGNQKAFHSVFTQYSGKVFTYALKLTHTKEVAEEIVQEVFMKVWLNRAALPDIDYFPSYLYTVTKNHTLNFLKRRAAEGEINLIFAEACANHEPEHHEAHQHILQHAIQKLPRQQQIVYRMCYHEGLRYEEVAERLCISHLTVKTHMQQALRSIRMTLQTPQSAQ